MGWAENSDALSFVTRKLSVWLTSFVGPELRFVVKLARDCAAASSKTVNAVDDSVKLTVDKSAVALVLPKDV